MSDRGAHPLYNTFFVDVTRFLDGSRLRDGLRSGLLHHRWIKTGDSIFRASPANIQCLFIDRLSRVIQDSVDKGIPDMQGAFPPAMHELKQLCALAFINTLE